VRPFDEKAGTDETTVRLFPDKDFDAATTRTTTKGHDTGPLSYSPLKSRKNLLSRIRKKGLVPYVSCIETLEKAPENEKSGCIVVGALGVLVA
jgi:hypothetical protein